MSGASLADSLTALLEPEAPGHGLELVAVEVVGGANRPTVRVYLDREGGIDLDAICDANGWISAALDGSELIRGAYTLEVSSPGIERPLRTLSDFDRYAGSEISLKTTTPVAGRSRFTGSISAVEGNDILLDVDGDEVRIAHGNVAKARLKVEIEL